MGTNFNGIVMGEALGAYKTVGITLGTAKKANNDGIISNYLVLSLKDEYSMLSGTRRVPLFEEDVPGAYEMFKPFAATTPDARGGFLVDMAQAKANQALMSEWGGLFRFPGGMVEEYKLSKGLCYQNDENGQRVMKDGRPVIRDTINVFTQVRLLMPDANGNMVPKYVDKFSLNEQGRRIEDAFYREAVNANPNPVNVVDDDLPPFASADAQQFIPQPPVQAPAQQQAVQQPAGVAQPQMAPQAQPQAPGQAPLPY